MSRIRTRFLVVVALVFGLSGAVRAESPAPEQPAEAAVDTLLDAIRANRRALVAINLQLTDEEAGKFWPVYDRYQGEINKVGDRLVALIKEYTSNFRTLSNDRALEIVKEYLAIGTDRARIRGAYLTEFAKALPGRKVARFYQIENKMDAVIRYDLASTIPVIDEQPAASATH